MSNFKGTINGVEYTNKVDFFKALEQLKGAQHCSVQYQETEDKRGQHQQRQQILTPSGDYTDMFAQIFGSFLGALGHYADNNKNNYNTQKASAKTERRVTEAPAATSIAILKENFVFPWTTYVFTGGTKDELELDKFSSLLKTKIEAFEHAGVETLSKADQNTLGHMLIQYAAKAKHNAEVIEGQMHEIDGKLVQYENLVKAYNELDIEIPTHITGSFEATKRSFDAKQNRVNYYKLMQEYYSELAKQVPYNEI